MTVLARHCALIIFLSIFFALAQAIISNNEPLVSDFEDGIEDEPLVSRFSYGQHRNKERQLRDEHRKNASGNFSEEYRLYMDLLGRSNYSRNIRPVRDHLKPIRVFVGMCVMMIEDLIEREQTMVMSACLKMLWRDEFLQWDPMDYGRLSWLAIDSNEIWLPDIAIVNSQNPLGLSKKQITVGVSHRGEVGYFPSGHLATRCNLQITYFPFDWQNCEVRFEAWIHPTQFLIFDLYPGHEAIDVKEYYENFQWSLKSYRIAMDNIQYDNKNFSSLTITYRLRRKSTFYFMYFIFPQFLLSTLQTLSHTLPVEHPGRMSMLTALFIGTSVTHAGIATHIPKSSDTMSVLQIYLTLMSCNLVIVLLITFVMLYTVLRHPDKEPSFWSMMFAFFSIVWPSKEIVLTNTKVDPFESTVEKSECSEALMAGEQDKFLVFPNKTVGFNDCPDGSIGSIEWQAIDINVPGPYHLQTNDMFHENSPSISDPPNFFNANYAAVNNWCQQCMGVQCPTKYTMASEVPSPVLTSKKSSSCSDSPASQMEKQNIQVLLDSKTNKPTVALFDEQMRQLKPLDRWQQRKNTVCHTRGTWEVNIEDGCEFTGGLQLRHKWVQYCVALDKTIMYFNGLANILIPLVLFYLMPLAHDYTHGYTFEV